MSQIIILHPWVCLTSLYFTVQRFFAAFVSLLFQEKPSYKTMECVTLLLCKPCSKCSAGGKNCPTSPNPYGGHCHPIPSPPKTLCTCWLLNLHSTERTFCSNCLRTCAFHGFRKVSFAGSEKMSCKKRMLKIQFQHAFEQNTFQRTVKDADGQEIPGSRVTMSWFS